jgi:hypothetical protein
MTAMNTLILVLATSLLAGSPAFADVHLTMHGGRVSIVATDATIRQILAEWARVGQTRIVNVERIPGGPITLELNNVTETQALDVLLRSLSGYVAAPRAVEVANLSMFDRIIVMPTLAAARTDVLTSPVPPLPVFQQAQAPPLPLPPVEDHQDDQPPAPNEAFLSSNGAVPPQASRIPVDRFQRSQEVSRQGVLPNGVIPQMPKGQMQTYPTSPVLPFGGVAVPGMVPAAAPAQGQPARRAGER